MIFMFTDFGADGPYLGQMEAVLRSEAPGCHVINLLSNAPLADPIRSSYLLAALARGLPVGSILLSVVDPGVGGSREPVVLRADGLWFVGPDNGLGNTLAVQAEKADWAEITWRPERLSASFHGRDLFAPVAARIARGDTDGVLGDRVPPYLRGWPADLTEVIYSDHYGNAITGLRYRDDLKGTQMQINGQVLCQGRTFCSVEPGAAFWYCNSMGLVEIAVNGGRADAVLGLQIGTAITFL